MSDWATMVATIRERNGKAASENDRIMRQICDSCALHRRERLRWNQSEFAITLTLDEDIYTTANGLPSDLVSIVGRELDLDNVGAEDDRSVVSWIDQQRMRANRRGVRVSGEPVFWTFWNEQLELWPPSDSSSHILRGPYIADVGTPTYTYTGGLWVFKNPSGSAITATSTYTSPWFDVKQGFNLISYHAEWQLWATVWKGATGQDQKAATLYTEARAAAIEITDSQSSGRGQIAAYDPR